MKIQIHLILFLIIGCQARLLSQATEGVAGGYRYVLHTRQEGARPGPGDYVFFHLQQRREDSILVRTRQGGAAPRQMQLPDAKSAGLRLGAVGQVLRRMAVGDSATVFVPVDSLKQRPRGFEDAVEVIYDVVLVDVKSAKDYVDARREANRGRAEEIRAQLEGIAREYRTGKLKDRLQRAPSGLRYLTLEQGSGPRVKGGMTVDVHYYGVLRSGKPFDNSIEDGNPFPVKVGEGEVIEGWDEGLPLFNQGGKGVLFIPSGMGYGPQGSPPSIPPDAELVFYIEVVRIR